MPKHRRWRIVARMGLWLIRCLLALCVAVILVPLALIFLTRIPGSFWRSYSAHVGAELTLPWWRHLLGVNSGRLRKRR